MALLTIKKLPSGALKRLQYAVESRQTWRGSLIGNPDPVPLAKFDALTALMLADLKALQEQQKELSKLLKNKTFQGMLVPLFPRDFSSLERRSGDKPANYGELLTPHDRVGDKPPRLKPTKRNYLVDGKPSEQGMYSDDDDGLIGTLE